MEIVFCSQLLAFEAYRLQRIAMHFPNLGCDTPRRNPHVTSISHIEKQCLHAAHYIFSMRICSQSTFDEHILHCETLFACRIGFLEGGMLSFNEQCFQCLHAILLLARNEPLFLALVRQ